MIRSLVVAVVLLVSGVAQAGQYGVAGWQPTSNTGALLPLGTLTFSRTGTSTAKAVYSNKALSSALSNPLSLDSSGRVSTNVFLLEDECYRVVLKNSAGTTIWTRDEQCALSLAVDELTDRKSIVRSPMDYGAVGDGSTNDYTAIAAAISAISTAGGGVLDLDGNTYRSDSTVALVSNLTIRNGMIDFSLGSAAAGLQCTGTAGEELSVSSASTRTQTITPSSLSGLSVGDLVRLRSSNTIVGTHKYAEMFRIQSLTATDVLVDGVILGTYSSTPLLQEVTPISDVRLESMTVKAPSGGFAIDISLCTRIRVRGVRLFDNGTADSAVRILSSYDISIDGGSSEPTSSSSLTSPLIIGDASRAIRVSNMRFERSEEIVLCDDYGTDDGLTRDVTFSGNTIEYGEGFIVHEGCGGDIRLIDNYFIGDTAPASSAAAILINSADNVEVRGNTFRDFTLAGVKIDLVRNATSVIVADNTLVTNEGSYAFHVTNTAFTLAALAFTGNTVTEGLADDQLFVEGTTITRMMVDGNSFQTEADIDAIDINSADSFGDVSISNNRFMLKASPSMAIRVRGGTATHMLISGNHVQTDGGADLTGISVTAATVVDLTVSNNTMWNISTGIATTNSAHCTIRGNDIDLDSTNGVLGISATAGDSSASVAIISNSIGQSGGGTGDGIFVDEYPAFTITGNRIDVSLDGIEVDNTTQEFTGGVIFGNHIAANDNGIEVDASDATGSNSLAITGNFVESEGGASEFVVQVTGIVTGIAVNGNSLRRTNDTDANLRIAGDGAGNMINVTVVGNHFHNGDVCIEPANNDAASTYHDANAFNSCVANDTGAGDTAVPIEST